ncbi:MAG: hypothetical protein SFV81_06175 [Pirellulaceae bacterium]|nr:hypothetical protein [Pirellulaceae bacterium]
MRTLVLVLLFGLVSACRARELTVEQKLVVACYKLDVDAVAKLLREGADVNARFGQGETLEHFREGWYGGTPMSAGEWTPLHALANSETYPDPEIPYENTVERLNWSDRNRLKAPKSEIEKRVLRRTTIFYILLSHGCNLDNRDSRGASPIYDAIARRHEALAMLLLDQAPQINTKTGIYIDGHGDNTPLHAACWSSTLTSRLIKMGADESSTNTAGETPLDYRIRLQVREETTQRLQQELRDLQNTR